MNSGKYVTGELVSSALKVYVRRKFAEKNVRETKSRNLLPPHHHPLPFATLHLVQSQTKTPQTRWSPLRDYIAVGTQ